MTMPDATFTIRNPEAVMQTRTRLASRLAGFRHNRKGVAAVEFAMLLPFILLVYFGTVETTQAVMASRKATIAARTIADLVAQQANGTSLTDAQANEVLSSASSIMSPFASTKLAVTVSSINIATNATTGIVEAKPIWTLTANGGVARPCQVLTSVSNTTTPTSTNLPSGIYTPGPVVVADVVFTYQPTFGSSLLNTQTGLSGVLTSRHTVYIRPRASSVAIPYSGSQATQCP